MLTSDNGPSRGVRLIQFSMGTGFTFEVALDRGMDVGRAEYRGASLAWMPPTLLPGPWFFEQLTYGTTIFPRAPRSAMASTTAPL